MNHYEIFALQEFLTNFPDGKTFNEILELIINEDDSIIVWEPFENSPPSWLAEKIEELRDNLECQFIVRPENDDITLHFLPDEICEAVRNDLMTFSKADLIDFIIIETDQEKLIKYANELNKE